MLLAELRKTRRHPADGVIGGELDPLAVGVAQARGEHLEQQQRHPRVALQVRAKGGGGHEERRHVLERRDRGRARPPVDRGELAENVTRLAEREHDLLAVPCQGVDLDPALEEHDHAVGLVVLVKEDRSALESARRAGRKQGGALGVGQHAKQATALGLG